MFTRLLWGAKIDKDSRIKWKISMLNNSAIQQWSTYIQYTPFKSWENPSSVTVNHHYDCFLMMDGKTSEVVVTSCAKGRAGSTSHTNSSVESDTVTRLHDKSQKYSAGTQNTQPTVIMVPLLSAYASISVAFTVYCASLSLSHSQD